MATVVPVILAGGSGTRLWPLSREDCPKQFLRIGGTGSLLQQTVRRALAAAPADRILTVADERHFLMLLDEYDEVDPALADGILLEPSGRNTAAALAYAAIIAEERWPDTILWAMPADHVIDNEDRLRRVFKDACAAAEADWIVTFGITPSRPETGFGYIGRGECLPDRDGVFRVADFIEKPPLEEAERLVANKDYCWNSGMLLTRARTFLDELATHAPGLNLAIRRALAARRRDRPVRVSADLYARIPTEPFDKAVLERSDRVAVVPCDLGWSDVGTWNNLWELLPRDADGNAVQGPVVLDRTGNCLLHANRRLVACTGVHDLVVVETPDAVLVADRSDATGIRQILERLKTENRPEVSNGATRRESWGHRHLLHRSPVVDIEELVILEGRQHSADSTADAGRLWIVTGGRGRIVQGGSGTEIGAGDTVEIPPGKALRLENMGPDPVRLIEIRHGSPQGAADAPLPEGVSARSRVAS